MANFEALIKQALQTQNSDDPAIREKIYNSSRNALSRMLEKSANQPDESKQAHFKSLENTILKIEAEYAPPIPTVAEPIAPTPEPIVQEQVAPLVAPQAPAPTVEPVVETRPARQVSPLETTESNFEPVAPNPEPIPVEPVQHTQQIAIEPIAAEPMQQEAYESVAVPPPIDQAPRYKRKNPFLRRIWWLLFIIAGLAVALWLLYAIGSRLGTGENASTPADNVNAARENSNQSENATYISLLTPNQPGALITSGRGSATLINELNSELLRIQSIRQVSQTEIADPILLELQPGVLQQIAGKEITVEIRAKSGGSGPATFSVGCDFGGQSSCSRKRFRIGLQPEDIVFALKMDPDTVNGNAFLTINTDIVSSADSTGTGDLVDIIYARVRLDN